MEPKIKITVPKKDFVVKKIVSYPDATHMIGENECIMIPKNFYWISTDDELPPKNEDVILHDDLYTWIGYYDGKEFVIPGKLEGRNDIQYWMPLPEPPDLPEKLAHERRIRRLVEAIKKTT